MAELTFEDLLNDPWSKRMIDDLEEKFGSPLPENLQLWILETTGSANMREEQQSRWIDSSVALTEKLVHGKPDPAEYSLFWIRLYGLLHELYPAMQSQRGIWEASFMKPIAGALDSLQSKFTEKELIFIRFFRHSHVHIRVDAWRHSIKKRKDETFSVKPPSLPNGLTIAREILEENDWDQQKTARLFAERILPAMQHLKRVYDRVKSEG